MLDAQRYRESSLYAEFRLVRGILLAHLATGVLVIVLLLLHEIFPWAVGTLVWFGATVLVLIAMAKGCRLRILMGLLFVLFSLCGVYFLAQVAPRLQPLTPPLLTHGIVTLWLGLANLAYLIGGLFFLFSPRIKKVTAHGFSLQ